MCKKSLQGSKMSDVAFVEQAIDWSRQLTRMKARGPGDTENAMRQIEREHGIDYSALWTLRYRPERFKDIGVGLYTRLQAAYQAECERQMRKMRHELEITERTHPTAASVAAAKAVVNEDI